jgi:hypothetical protein|tara:strand:+ start:14499 stop:15137 length:639 start_codon:yes stop_codon:yes gene_type:complete
MKMGWFFNRNNETPTQQFGASNSMGMTGMGGYGMQGGMGAMGAAGGMMDPMMMQQMGQNPMMQQMANDPVIATSRLLQYYDPLNQFIVANQFSMMMDLVAEIVTLSLKDFFSNVQLAAGEDGKLSLDTTTLPANIATLSPENLALTLQTLRQSAQQQLQMNQQQTQMLLQAHNPMMNPQPGFFGSLVGGLLGQQMQNQGGMGAMGAGAAALI